MTERRPPGPPPSPPQRAQAPDLEDSTLLAPRPDFSVNSAEPGSSPGDGIVFDEEDEATIAGRLRAPVPVRTSDVSIISAQENSPAMSDPGFASPPPGGVFSLPPTLPGEPTSSAPRRPAAADLDDDPGVFDHHPSTEVLRLAFSDPGADPLPEPASTVAAPVEVRKWRMGGEVQPPANAPRPLPPAGGEPATAAAPPAAPASPRARAVVALHSLPDGAPPPPTVNTRVDGGGAQSGRLALDVDELRRTLEDAERLLKTVKSQASGLDLEARGMNAQLAAALHRIGEALDLLKRS